MPIRMGAKKTLYKIFRYLFILHVGGNIHEKDYIVLIILLLTLFIAEGKKMNVLDLYQMMQKISYPLCPTCQLTHLYI